MYSLEGKADKNMQTNNRSNSSCGETSEGCGRKQHDGQERGLLEDILKLNPLKGGEVSERKGREKRVDAEATVGKRPWAKGTEESHYEVVIVSKGHCGTG